MIPIEKEHVSQNSVFLFATEKTCHASLIFYFLVG